MGVCGFFLELRVSLFGAISDRNNNNFSFVFITVWGVESLSRALDIMKMWCADIRNAAAALYSLLAQRVYCLFSQQGKKKEELRTRALFRSDFDRQLALTHNLLLQRLLNDFWRVWKVKRKQTPVVRSKINRRRPWNVSTWKKTTTYPRVCVVVSVGDGRQHRRLFVWSWRRVEWSRTGGKAYVRTDTDGLNQLDFESSPDQSSPTLNMWLIL